MALAPDVLRPTSSVQATQNRVLRNTYWLLALSLVPTAVGALVGMTVNFSFLAASPIMSGLVFLAIVYGLFFAIERNKNSSTGVVLLLGLTLFLGFALAPTLQVALGLKNGGQLVALAAGGTAAVFFGLSALASAAGRDFSGLAKFLTVGVIVAMVGVVANLFLQIPLLHLVLSGVFVILCSLIILFQINQIVRGGETNYVTATLTLYMSIYNIFVSLLNILMAVSGQRE